MISARSYYNYTFVLYAHIRRILSSTFKFVVLAHVIIIIIIIIYHELTTRD